MAAAKQTLAELQKLAVESITQSRVVSEANVHNVKGLKELRSAVDTYVSSSARVFDTLAKTTTTSLKRTEATLGQVLVSNNTLDAAVEEMHHSLEAVLHRVDSLEQAPVPMAPQHMLQV